MISFVNKIFIIVILMITCLAAYAQSNLYIYEAEGKCGYKNAQGEIVISHSMYSECSNFVNGLATVKSSGVELYLDAAGNWQSSTVVCINQSGEIEKFSACPGFDGKFVTTKNLTEDNSYINDKIVAPKGTDFSVKMKSSFSDLKIGDTLNFIVNPRTLKNESINWEYLNITPKTKNRPYFVGKVASVYTKRTESGYTFYFARFYIDRFVVNGNEYYVSGVVDTEENVFTYNYDLRIEEDLRLSSKDNKPTPIVDNLTSYFNTSNLKSSLYTKRFYNAAYPCIPLLKIGEYQDKMFSCLLVNMRKTENQEGYVKEPLPYVFKLIYKTLPDKNDEIYRELHNLSITRKDKITPELYNIWMYGNE